jgi:uncharacterized protein (TIGR02466 family)
MIDFNVIPLFPKAFYRSSIDVLTESEKQFIRDLEMKENIFNLMSINQYVLNEPPLSKLNDMIHAHINTYAQEIMGIENEVYVTQSWSLTNLPGSSMHPHAHSNSIISGSYYYDDLPEPGSVMTFERNPGNQSVIKFNVKKERQNAFNALEMVIGMQKHELFLFPSDISHSVSRNDSNYPRRSIAFNCFVRGELGGYETSNQLFLK